LASKPARSIAGHDLAGFPFVIGLSVAVGRFVEALFWAIFRVASAAIALAILAVVARRVLRRGTRPRG
jgi:hypothetical protein